ncbi:hypothetical protein JOF53_003508 [Crossiella equi]|uniref:MAPEG family protein n=1 Tax=Crossiella equi TaxID=130796 RepID=A0ABS5AE83_9PSEU|nr:hypothetical protein [Crossiella equi]MBP2474636.1 hypothetical protein [Crossiella equi]
MLSALGFLLVGSLLRLAAPPVLLAVVATVWLVVLLAREFGLVSFPLPQNARLVPETVFRHGRVFGPLQFGLEMGTGMRTYVTSGLPYAALVLVALFSSPLDALLAGLAFGAGRATMLFGALHHGPPGTWDAAWLRYRTSLTTFLAVTFTLAQLALVLPLF